MRLYAVAILLSAFASCMGCQTCSTPAVCETPVLCVATPQPNVIVRDIQERQAVMPQSSVYSPAFAAEFSRIHYTDTIPAQDIRIQNITGVNAVLLLQAIEAALGKINLAVSSDVERIVKGDEVVVTTAPDRSDQVAYTHRIVARIDQASKQVTFTVYTQGQISSGRGGADPTPEVPERIFKALRAALIAAG
jgi:hypothetical protein